MTYTEKELDQFLHGISQSLLSKKSAQHWRYDEETAKEIEWLEALERKVRADKADRKTENSSEKPNNCETCRHWYTRKDIYDLDDAYCELFYDNAPCKYEPMDEPRTSEIIEAYSRGFRDGAEAVKAVLVDANGNPLLYEEQTEREGE